MSLSLVPKPSSTILLNGRFSLKSVGEIISSDICESEAIFLKEFIKIHYNHKPELRITNFQGSSNEKPTSTAKLPTIVLEVDPVIPKKTNEDYQLHITPSEVHILAPTPTGIFYGIQSLCQLAGAYGENIPSAKILDSPRFPWRGFMLDEGRHFFGKEAVLKLLDVLALLKINRFHWHLVEDQGWRIEIKKYPKLTEIGASRPNTILGRRKRDGYEGKPHEGYYTQVEIREIVAYAKKCHIVVIPEIELPGHCTAALAAYPEYSCRGDPLDVPTNFGIFKDIFCAGKESTFTFLQDILDEIIPLFPDPYIHLGGDEAPKKRWKACPKCQQRIVDLGLKNEKDLQAYFINRIIAYLADYGKIGVGWNEILSPDLHPKTIAQFWMGRKATKLKYLRTSQKMIMSDFFPLYLDYNYGMNSLRKVYGYEPIPKDLPADKHKNVVGLEAPLWTEFVSDIGRISYQIFPRLIAIAEVGWTTIKNKNYADFLEHLRDITPMIHTLGFGIALEEEWDPKGFRRLGKILAMFSDFSGSVFPPSLQVEEYLNRK
ncbi:MAG: beta-N-acetylhexosaminidase [Promethearchaeota archaeon]